MHRPQLKGKFSRESSCHRGYTTPSCASALPRQTGDHDLFQISFADCEEIICTDCEEIICTDCEEIICTDYAVLYEFSSYVGQLCV
jgi:hypothetical protein